MNLLLEPHQDDATLFASFYCLRYRPRVVTLLRSRVQELRGTGITDAERCLENARAMEILGCPYEQWNFSDDEPDWPLMEDDMYDLREPLEPELVFAPAYESGGHAQHNMVAEIASRVFGDRVRPYLTYVRGQQRTKGVPVPFEPHWPQVKLLALASFGSQIREPSTRDWFLWEQYEYAPSAWWNGG